MGRGSPREPAAEAQSAPPEEAEDAERQALAAFERSADAANGDAGAEETRAGGG